MLYLIPLTLLLPLLFTADPLQGVWWSLPVSDTLSAITAAIMLFIQIRSFRQLIAEQEQYMHTTPPEPD